MNTPTYEWFWLENRKHLTKETISLRQFDIEKARAQFTENGCFMLGEKLLYSLDTIEFSVVLSPVIYSTFPWILLRTFGETYTEMTHISLVVKQCLWLDHLKIWNRREQQKGGLLKIEQNLKLIEHDFSKPMAENSICTLTWFTVISNEKKMC